jgi:hypothetical protein
MIVFIRGEDEESVIGCDAVIFQAREEFVEGIIVGRKLRDVSSLSGAKRTQRRRVVVMRVGNIRVRDGHTVFLHRRSVS